MSMLAKTPAPPYYAVIFTNVQTTHTDGYGLTAQRMVELAAQQPGFLGIESAREELGITVSYWSSLESIANWKANAEHRLAQQQGQQQWYKSYKTRIALVERDYSMEGRGMGHRGMENQGVVDQGEGDEDTED